MPDRKGLSDEQWAALIALLNQASKATLEMNLAVQHLPLEQMASVVEERTLLAQGCFEQICDISDQALPGDAMHILSRAAILRACFECSGRRIKEQIKSRRYWLRRHVAAGQKPEVN